MSDQKKEQAAGLIILDVDGVISYGDRQGNPNILHIPLLTCFFEIMAKYNIKVVLGSQRLSSLLDKKTTRDQKKILALFRIIKQYFYPYLTEEDARRLVDEINKRGRGAEVWGAENGVWSKQYTKRPYLDVGREIWGVEAKNTILIDDGSDLIDDVKGEQSSIHDEKYADCPKYLRSIWVSNPQAPGENALVSEPLTHPFFMLDAMLTFLTHQQIVEEIAEMEPSNRTAFLNLLQLHYHYGNKVHNNLKAAQDREKRHGATLQARNNLIVYLTSEHWLKKIIRCLLWPVALFEHVMRNINVPGTGLWRWFFNSFALFFWPQKLVQEYPKHKYFFMLMHLAIWITFLTIFVFPPLAGFLAGVIGTSFELGALTEVVFGLFAAAYLMLHHQLAYPYSQENWESFIQNKGRNPSNKGMPQENGGAKLPDEGKRLQSPPSGHLSDQPPPGSVPVSAGVVSTAPPYAQGPLLVFAQPVNEAPKDSIVQQLSGENNGSGEPSRTGNAADSKDQAPESGSGSMYSGNSRSLSQAEESDIPGKAEELTLNPNQRK